MSIAFYLNICDWNKKHVLGSGPVARLVPSLRILQSDTHRGATETSLLIFYFVFYYYYYFVK